MLRRKTLSLFEEGSLLYNKTAAVITALGRRASNGLKATDVFGDGAQVRPISPWISPTEVVHYGIRKTGKYS